MQGCFEALHIEKPYKAPPGLEHVPATKGDLCPLSILWQEPQVWPEPGVRRLMKS